MANARVLKFKPGARLDAPGRRVRERTPGILIPFPSGIPRPYVDRGSRSQPMTKTGSCDWHELMATLSRLFRRCQSNAAETNPAAASRNGAIKNCMNDL